VLGDYGHSGPGLQMHSRPPVTPLRLFFLPAVSAYQDRLALPS
jgi:hypothetical protein